MGIVKKVIGCFVAAAVAACGYAYLTDAPQQRKEALPPAPAVTTKGEMPSQNVKPEIKNETTNRLASYWQDLTKLKGKTPSESGLLQDPELRRRLNVAMPKELVDRILSVNTYETKADRVRNTWRGDSQFPGESPITVGANSISFIISRRIDDVKTVEGARTDNMANRALIYLFKDGRVAVDMLETTDAAQWADRHTKHWNFASGQPAKLRFYSNYTCLPLGGPKLATEAQMEDHLAGKSSWPNATNVTFSEQKCGVKKIDTSPAAMEKLRKREAAERAAKEQDAIKRQQMLEALKNTAPRP